jgi:alkylation response protein AidB-like acyl-CoA dehydrogenase
MDLDQVARGYGGTLGPLRDRALAFLRQLGKDGWLGIGTPKEYGGQGRSFVEQWLFQEELKYRRLPTGSMLIQAVMPTLILFASEEMKRRFLPLCMSGAPNIAIGYSEPQAGTDLAALTTRAVRTTSGYVVNGEKTWCSHAHTATHIWLAARTGTPESRHKGISLFIIPADLPGITIQPIVTELGERVNNVFFNDVAVSNDMRVGEENDGWKYIMAQLNFERVFCHAEMLYDFHALVGEWLRTNGGDPAERAFTRRELARLAADVQVCRLMAMRSAWMMDAGLLSAQVAASIAKIAYSSTHQNVGITGFKLMGRLGQLALGDPRVPAEGRPARAYLASPVFKFGGGTNELQRDLIAGFGLGLPRTR